MRRDLDLKEVWLKFLCKWELEEKLYIRKNRELKKEFFSKINKGDMTSINETMNVFEVAQFVIIG